ncbi:flavin monoamine oxidase family protein [Planomonospora parontospora]|uniref:flavin monoamine oxidase family protein n=2 Tax=Planomonospora parontospora TaxID=58119 RepID=UPI00199FB190|nr:flavin monoamine oxidase family protein [Planomonospora parontospora]GGL35137.1 flavin monoamine oxidase [Planomonospora parontospora subsp. antibiotica]GII17260.1 flavin monoamine oxidase [Planomonospora parontospora subsp. antibiotica]
MAEPDGPAGSGRAGAAPGTGAPVPAGRSGAGMRGTPGAPGTPGALTRRALLVGVGAAGGAGAMYAAMGALGLAPDSQDRAFTPPQRSDFSLTGRGAAKVVVLGAGIAGLTCAYELGKAGYDCTVLEAADRVGGRNLTVRGGDRLTELGGETQTAEFGPDVYFNAGPGRIAQWMVTMDYCRELGVPLEVFVNGNASAYVRTHAMDAPVRVRTARADMYGYIAELLAKAADAGALDRRLTGEDRERLTEFLRRFGDLGPDLSYRGSPRRGFTVHPGHGSGEPLAGPPPLGEVLAAGTGRALTADFGFEQAMPMFQPVGGMDAIVRALAREVGEERILTGAPVTGVRDLPDGVEVTYSGGPGGSGGAVRADYCVATLPPHLLARVPHNLGARVTAALRTPTPIAAGKLGLEYGRRWWETDDRIYGGITETDLDITHIWYPSHGYHGRTGLLVGYYNTGAEAELYGSLPHPERRARALTQGKKIHGEKYRAELRSSVSVAWHRRPYVEGGWAVWPSYGGAFTVLQQPAGRVHFAGDWLTHLVAWQAGAMESARKAVTALHQRVLAAS